MIKLNNLKKAAMFGLDARIKKLCHTGLDPVSHALNNKHGAMFGLDARIALAIFGALSVISGAALYSAIQESKVTSYIASINEVSKAIEQYMLDNAEDLPLVTSHTYDAENLIVEREPSSNWNGPYINLNLPPLESNAHIVGKPGLADTGNIFVKMAPNSSWADPDAVGVCDGSLACYYWIEKNCYSLSSVKLIDKKIDISLSATEGKIRYNPCPDTGFYKLYYQSIKTLKQK